VGTAFFPADGADAEDLLAEADRRMYLKKRLEREDAREGHLPKPAARAKMSVIN
jgi:hypothetical protein